MSASGKRRAPGWLGLYCGNLSLEELETWFAAAADHGFREVQPAMCWSPLTPSDFDAVRALLLKYHLRARCIGIYNDLYKWDGPLQWKNTAEDLRTAIAHAPACGTDLLVCWSGSAAEELGATDERNRAPEALARLHEHAKRLLLELAASGASLLFEPWRTHVLNDEQSTAAFCARYAGRIGAVLDPPNFIRPEDWPHREERLRSIRGRLGEHVRMAHLKDMRVDEQGNFAPPMFGRGGLDTAEILQALAPMMGRIPIIAEHVPAPSDLPELLDHIADALSKSPNCPNAPLRMPQFSLKRRTRMAAPKEALIALSGR